MTDSTAPVPARRGRRRLGLWLGLGAGVLALVVVAAGLVVALVPEARPVRSYRITSASMEPTLQPGSTIVVTTVVDGWYQPHRGDIVVYTRPAAWGAYRGPTVSRVIATEHQTVRCDDDGQPAFVDGRQLVEPYARDGCGPAAFVAKVPAGRVWLMGDNPEQSYDSSTYYVQTEDPVTAAIPLSAVIGVRRS